MLLCYSTLELIRSEFIDPDTCTWFLWKFFCVSFQNRTYIFSLPIDLEKFVARVTVGHAYFPSVLDKF